MDTAADGNRPPPLERVVDGLSPRSRLKLLRVADDLVVYLKKSKLPPPPGPFTQNPGSDRLQAVPFTPVEDTEILDPKLGVLRIDYKYEAAVGDIDNGGSFGYTVVYEVIKGLTFEMCQSGDLPEGVVNHFITAVRRLRDAGCDVITGDCGFMFQFQQAAMAIADRPSMMLLSPLSQLATLISGLAPDKKIAIMTANSDSFEKMRKLLENAKKGSAGWAAAYGMTHAPHDRYHIIGCQRVKHFGQEVAKGKPIVYELAEPGIVALAQQTLRDHHDVDMFLLECTELPQFANTLRFKTGKPVYTAITLANMAMDGRRNNPRFGRHHWRKEWRDQQRARMAMHLRQEDDPEGAQAAEEGLRDTNLMQSIANKPPPQHADDDVLKVLHQLSDL